MTVREHVLQLVERLPEHSLADVERYLERLYEESLPPSLRDAPADDEPETDTERAAVAEAKADLAAGRTVSDEEMAREFDW